MHALPRLVLRLLVSLTLAWGLAVLPAYAKIRVVHMQAHPNPSAAYQWLDIILEATARDVDRSSPRPTIISRQVAIPLTAMFDAWAAYDSHAVATRLGSTLRRPGAEHTQANKETAIAYAAYRCLVDQFPADKAWLDEQMRARGLDPGNLSQDPRTAVGIGNLNAKAVLDFRHHDGANQLGDELGGSATAYADYTGYSPVNQGTIINPDRWQPIPFSDGHGGTYTPGFLTPHWYRVKPFALDRAEQFRPPPPPRVGSAELKRQVAECIQLNAHLTVEQKSIVEFMRDGPRSTGQSGHWLRFAQDLSRRDSYTLDQDVELFFCIANVAMDAFIAAWDAKRYYDSSRPWTLVRWYYKGQQVEGWGGPCQGVVRLDASQWHPYSPAVFVTPPFPGYVAGHSTVSAAAATMLALFSGSDRYDGVALRHAGELTEPGCEPTQMQAHLGTRPTTPPSLEVSLEMPTFWSIAEMAGTSRILGGYHLRADNEQGLLLGRKVARFCWPRLRAYINGTAAPAQDPPRPQGAGVP
jgi:PAP2 superfamily